MWDQWLSGSGPGVDTDTLRRMTDVIRHRGPDDEGYALIGKGARPFTGERTRCPQLSLPLWSRGGSGTFLGLGHRRLSILDLSAAGHQPMSLPAVISRSPTMGSSITIWSCGRSWRRWGIAFGRTAIPRSCSMPTASGARTAWTISMACGALPSGTAKRTSCFAPGTGWEPSPFTTTTAPTSCCWAPN